MSSTHSARAMRIVAIVAAASAAFAANNAAAAAVQNTYRDRSIIGPERSRYPDRSPFWEIAERADGEVGSVTAPGFRFVWGNRAWHAEGAVAMAASVALQQFVGLAETHRTFCSGEANCDMVDFETRHPSARFAVRRLLPLRSDRDRRDALARCQTAFPAFRDDLRAALRSDRGVVLAVYRTAAFARTGDGVENASIHMFALYGVDRGGNLLLRDAADRVPVTYRIRTGRECEALTVPRGFEVERESPFYKDWALTAWLVEPRPGRDGGVAPRPAPRPVPSPLPPSPVPLETDDVPGVAGDDPFDLGAFRLPAPQPPANVYVYATGGGAPARLRLRTGIAASYAQDSQRVLTELERLWSVSRQGERISYQPRDRATSPFSDAYRTLGRSDRVHLTALARRFEVSARRLSKNRVWLATSVIRFVQNIPYELIRDDVLGLRTPVSVLNRNGGDCDSKSLLAAVLLRILGFQTIVLTNDRLSHAVLGVELPVAGDAYTVYGNRRYLLVECTNPFAIGDLSASGTHGEARNAGWEIHEVDI